MTEVNKSTLAQLIELAALRTEGIMYEGFTRDDENLPGNLIIVESPAAIFSFNKKDILQSEELSGNRSRLWVRVGANAIRMSSFIVGTASPFLVGMEELAPPKPIDDPRGPAPVQFNALTDLVPAAATAATLSGVASAWTNSCIGGDSYSNNCAHFLSDAFIRAGFSELLPPNSHINARCPSKRPIRAREMWNWFRAKAVRSRRDIQMDTGWWAIFQLKESVYWGGHVVVLNTSTSDYTYTGTGWYGDWDQYLYQW